MNATRNFAPTRSATSAAALAMMPPLVLGCQSMAAIRLSPWRSVDWMIRAIVSTASMGYSPTLVSPESITASAPSRTALATSDASARVGAGLLIIDSSIWVATITGLALRRAFSITRFWRNGTSSRGHSTPRSPRATMNASNALITSSRLSMACGFSILAMTGSITPSSRMMSRTISTSLPDRTNDRATKSTVRCSANRRSSMSFSDSAGTLTATPGRLMPLLLLTGPPTTTSVTTSLPRTSLTRSRILPSSIRIGSPGLTSPGSPSYVVPQIVASPGTSRTVITNSWPCSRTWGPSANVSSRILGPCRSAKMPTPCPVSSAACRTRR